jgi:hypothetical protein
MRTFCLLEAQNIETEARRQRYLKMRMQLAIGRS